MKIFSWKTYRNVNDDDAFNADLSRRAEARTERMDSSESSVYGLVWMGTRHHLFTQWKFASRQQLLRKVFRALVYINFGVCFRGKRSTEFFDKTRKSRLSHERLATKFK